MGNGYRWLHLYALHLGATYVRKIWVLDVVSGAKSDDNNRQPVTFVLTFWDGSEEHIGRAWVL